MKEQRARVFWSGRSQAIRLPKEFRVEGEAMRIRREGNAIILEPLDAWPEGYFESFTGGAWDDFERPPQGEHQEREPFE